jgi:hypothetical protein
MVLPIGRRIFAQGLQVSCEHLHVQSKTKPVRGPEPYSLRRARESCLRKVAGRQLGAKVVSAGSRPRLKTPLVIPFESISVSAVPLEGVLSLKTYELVGRETRIEFCVWTCDCHSPIPVRWSRMLSARLFRIVPARYGFTFKTYVRSSGRHTVPRPLWIWVGNLST